MISSQTFQKGFTLIELLVVISIISLLSVVVLSSVTTARQKAAVSRSISDAHQVELAFDLLYDQTSYYPNQDLFALPEYSNTVSILNELRSFPEIVNNGYIRQLPEQHDSISYSIYTINPKKLPNGVTCTFSGVSKKFYYYMLTASTTTTLPDLTLLTPFPVNQYCVGGR